MSKRDQAEPMTGEGRTGAAATGGERRLSGDGDRRGGLTAEERRLLDFAEVSSDWFYELDRDLKFSLLSSGSSKRTGEAPSALLGRMPTKEGLEGVGDEAWAAHLADLAARRPIVDFRFARRGAGGRLRHFSINAKPIFGPSGAFAGYRGTGREVTALVDTQARLRESERRFRDFAESSSHWLWELDREMRYTFVSDGVRAMTGLPPEAYVGLRLFDTHAGQGMDPAAKRQFLEVLDKREPFMDVPVIQTAAGGRIRHLRISGRPFHGEDGAFLGHRGSTRDVTPQYDAEADSARWRQARDIAAAADLAKTRFLAHMSHELRTPLNAILGFAEIMQTELYGPLGDDSYREYAYDIGVSGRHLLGIINDLLDMSRIELGQFQQSPENVVLADVVDEAVRMARGYAQGLGPTIEATHVDAAWVINVDRRAIRQILLNLLSNAAKFTPTGHRVWVRVEGDRAGDLTVAVADTGCGIAPDRLLTIFEPFQRGNAELTRGGRGAGLGLWLSRSLTEMHGGRLDLDSREGEGTTATVTLPASRVTARP